MPMSPLPAAILSHMIAVSNVPPPPLRSIPNLQKSRHIDYGQLNALCHMREKQHSRTNILSAHNVFMKQYPKIFLQKKVRLPKLFKEEETRIPAEDTAESKPLQPDDSHNIAIHVKKARGGRTLYGPKQYEEKVAHFMAILKKLPIHRTPSEHNIVWKMLKTIPDLTSQLLDEHLKVLSKNVISETWIKGSTVIGNDGFYIILKGLARPQTQIYKNLIEEHDSTTSFIPQSFHSFDFSEEFRNPLLAGVGPMLGQWSTFGTLEVAAHIESETKEYSVVTEEDCEILKIPANNFAKLKAEKTKLENQQKVKLIHKCPYYVEWPTLSIYELVTFTKWKKFPPGHDKKFGQDEIMKFLEKWQKIVEQNGKYIVRQVTFLLNIYYEKNMLAASGRLKEVPLKSDEITYLSSYHHQRQLTTSTMPLAQELLMSVQQRWFEKLCKGDESLEDEECRGQPSEADNDLLRRSSRLILLQLQKRSKNSPPVIL
ncbi:cyclic nucleotide-binding domain-containing protein 1-like [Bos indicus]|uniref:Cyclic nucleotide-binding domain-containing protein 1-like n=1 Tax=Bos indicus TaxID=9915 RepID=A0ABM4TE02_BOSIN